MPRRPGLLAFLLVCALAALPCAAQGTQRDVRVGGGIDVLHKSGMPMISLTVDNFSLLTWDAHFQFGVGLSYPFGGRTGWTGSAGAIVTRRTDDDVGVHLNFLFRAGYCGEKLCLSYAHISHGALLGIETGAANSGLNFVFLEYHLP